MAVAFQPTSRNWSEIILDGARPYMNAQVAFYSQVIVPHNPQTGAPPTEVNTIIWEGKARVQQLRTPRDVPAGYEQTANRAFRFQLDPLDEPPFFEQGTLARVIDGGRDEALLGLQFQVNSSVNSSHMAVRTVELTAAMDSSPIPVFS